MHVNQEQLPFSCYGSYFVLSQSRGSGQRSDGLYLRNVRGGDEKWGELFHIELVREDGRAVHYEVRMTPSQLTLDAGGEQGATFCFAAPHVLRVRSLGVRVRLTMETGAYDYAFQTEPASALVNSFTQTVRLRLAMREGELSLDAPWNGVKSARVVITFVPDEKTGAAECALEEFITVRQGNEGHDTFGECVAKQEGTYRDWLDHVLPVPQEFAEGRELAAYITWSSVVSPSGLLTRPAMYMSKNWMTNIWSWDHCFNAMALARGNPQLAFDQIMLFFDCQDASGVLPDFLNDSFALWNCCKPPIHGWAVGWMMERSDFFTLERLRELYEPLAKWTSWWLVHRKQSAEGLYCYHHGNDSGWDNSTVFAEGVPVESPDLAAYLCLQMETLSQIAERLGQHSEAREWHDRYEQLLHDLLQRFWTGERFVARMASSGQAIEADSLLLMMPIVLGERLPATVRDRVVAALKQTDGFLTEHGFATERIGSSSYVPDGYWRGPIWAPSTMLIVDGLRKAGEDSFAREIARRFCRMAQNCGMAENFDAQSGRALRDPAFTWTSSVYLILAHEYV
ncbi:hypothetical protein EDM56_23795 [Brevibacillus fluminis]|uniref:Mannosylglycerate hydrolase MGH1-like glycoside hydrolase domain-containing protein n=1 Tax=Brevibacillus fluminis TaxID=511487 RepID=A0A3M8D2P8_9BACL|nr:trehalase family glycosidase [Brevibacillus fluminis]RNB82350.1 hypothetical protein EDM56_23795 [Brevibacillus fluminis]